MRILELQEQPRTVPQSGGKVQTHAFEQEVIGGSGLVADASIRVTAMSTV